MIVKDKKYTINKANEISNKLLKIIRQELPKCQKELDDDPAEFIYLLIHTTSIFNMKIYSLLELYGKQIYGIDNADVSKFKESIDSCTSEYMKEYSNEK